jgi:hypothetical protein
VQSVAIDRDLTAHATAETRLDTSGDDTTGATRSTAGLQVAAAIAALVAIGLVIRLVLCALPLGQFDGDEATTGLMVRNILHGHFYVYMAGQDYNGALEQYLQAAVWAVAPQNMWTLRFVDLALYAGTAVVIYRVARIYFAETWRRLTAVGIFCLGPYFNVWKGIHSHGAYSVGQLVGAFALLIAARASTRKSNAGHAAFAMGLAIGLTYWLSWTTLVVVLPAALWIAPIIRQRARHAAHAVIGIAVGAAPAIGYAIQHRHFAGLGGPQPDRSVLERLTNFADPIAREFFGFGYRYGKPGLPVVVQRLIATLVGAALLAYLVRRSWQIASALFDRRGSDTRPTDVLLLIPLAAAAAFATSRYSWWTGEPRYLFSLYPALALGGAAILRLRFNHAYLAGGAAVLLAGTSTLTAIGAHADDGPKSETTCLTRVANDLAARGITDVYSDYWTGMPLQLVAGERLIVGPVGGGRTKFPYQRRAVDQAPQIYYLAGHLRDPMNEQSDDVAKVRAELKAHHVAARTTPIGGCAVLFSDFRPAVRPWQIGLGVPVGIPG